MVRPSRRRKFICGALQRRLLLAFGMHTLVVVGLFAAALYIPALVLFYRSRVLNPEMADSARLLIELNHELLPALIAVIAATAVSAVLISHRVAGPLIQLHRVSERIQAGDIQQRLHLRKHDYLKLEAEAINAMLDSLTAKPQSSQASQSSQAPGRKRELESIKV